MNENAETVGAGEAAQTNAAAETQAQGGNQAQGVGQATPAAQGDAAIVVDENVLQGTAGARVDTAPTVPVVPDSTSAPVTPVTHAATGTLVGEGSVLTNAAPPDAPAPGTAPASPADTPRPGVMHHLAMSGSEMVAAAGDAVTEAKGELTKLDITLETFVRAHMNSTGHAIDQAEETLANAFINAVQRIRGQ